MILNDNPWYWNISHKNRFIIFIDFINFFEVIIIFKRTINIKVFIFIIIKINITSIYILFENWFFINI